MKIINKISDLLNICLQKLCKTKVVALALLGLLVIWPNVYITRYSFPAQDDFDYAAKARSLMEEGYGVVGQAFHMVKEWHMTWGGLYSSTFFGYLFSGIVMCDPHKVRVFELCSALIFFVGLALMSYAFARYIFRIGKKEAVTIFTFFSLFMFGVAYFGDFDVFYWFITSVQYLLLLAFFEIGLSMYIFAFNTGKKGLRITYTVAAVIFGFLASGANLCLTALNCFWFVVIAGYMFVNDKEKKDRKFCIVAVVPVVGALINGTAPGNYVRAGGGKGLADILLAARSSVRYVFERLELYIKLPEFWLVLLGLILATLYIPREKKALGFTIRFPAIVAGMLMAILAGVIFPAMLGYKYNVFCLLIRGQVILDYAMFTFMVFGILLLEQWFYDKYGDAGLLRIKRDMFLGIITLMIGISLQLRDNKWRWVGVIRDYRDLDAGRFEPFTNYFLDILNQVEESPDEVAVIYVDEEVAEKTIQINPMIAYDICYDPENDYQNNAIAHFYNKKGVWVLHKEYMPTEEDFEVAKKYGIEDKLIIPEITNEEDIDAAADDAVGNDK